MLLVFLFFFYFWDHFMTVGPFILLSTSEYRFGHIFFSSIKWHKTTRLHNLYSFSVSRFDYCSFFFALQLVKNGKIFQFFRNEIESIKKMSIIKEYRIVCAEFFPCFFAGKIICFWFSNEIKKKKNRNTFNSPRIVATLLLSV